MAQAWTAIEDPDDPRIDAYRNLRDASLRRLHDAFLVEGRINVEALATARSFEAVSALVLPAIAEGLENAWREIRSERPDFPVYVAERDVLEGIVGFDLHRGCLALAKRPAPLGLESLIAAGKLLIGLEDLRDSENVGSVFRNSHALGAAGVLLSPECCDPLYRKSVRVSMGAALHLPYARVSERGDAWPRELDRFRDAGFEVIALHPAGDPLPSEGLWASAPSPPARVLLLAGTEGRGLSGRALEACDRQLRIPMLAEADSINVATSVAVALHAFSGYAKGVV